MERVSTVGYYAIKQCLVGFITERGESRCSVCAVTMPNCSADKGIKAFNQGCNSCGAGGLKLFQYLFNIYF